ncbi:GDSL-type esterase/lipase family protein [Saccharobesus litoralis]|uniref:GDSL-type esterase/lipase family protein n=1 Tax=Saccharobesus litoralis TaxID=2172099 RepID=UPI00131EF677|nr:GDSL-type esterase/lipase family protein [Saccharobesus litoralis]
MREPQQESKQELQQEQHPAIVPAQQTDEWAVPWWLPRHQAKLHAKQIQGQIDLLFLGDSITQAWEDRGAAVWQKYYQPRHAFNLGFSGDRTENVLWRIEHGELDNIAPKLLVLMIGSNNTGHRMDPAEQTAKGIELIIQAIQAKLANSRILLLGLLPREASPDDPMRLRNNEINKLIKPLANQQNLFWLDIGELFLDEQGVIQPDVMSDGLHPNQAMYLEMALALEPTIKHLLDDTL